MVFRMMMKMKRFRWNVMGKLSHLDLEDSLLFFGRKLDKEQGAWNVSLFSMLSMSGHLPILRLAYLVACYVPSYFTKVQSENTLVVPRAHHSHEKSTKAVTS